MSASSRKYRGPRKPSSPSRGSRGSMARSIRRPRRGSAYRLKSTSMFRFQAGSSPSQCHQFRSPAWKMVWPSAVTRKATPSSVEGRVSTVTPGRGEAARHRRRAPGICRRSPRRGPSCSRFRSVRRMPLPSRKRISRRRRPGRRFAGQSGPDGGGWRTPAGAFRPAAAAASPFHQSNSRVTDGSSTRKPLWSRKVTVITGTSPPCRRR